jgi:hypothetical protein
LKPQISPIGKETLSRIYDNEPAPLFIGPPKALSLIFVRIGPEGVAGPNDNALGFTLIVTDRQISTGDQGCPNTGDITLMACGEYIGCAQEVGKPIKKALIIPPCSLSNNNGFRTMRLNDLFEPFGDGIQGYIPGNPLPSFIVPLHGIKDPIGMVCQLKNRQPLGAHTAVAYRRPRIPLNLYHLAIFDMGDDTAPSMATTASCPDPLYLIHYYLLFVRELIS